MTKIVIYKMKNHITGFEVSGHTGYADEGQDIVCSAVSTACSMAVVGVQKVLKLQPFVAQSDGYLKMKLKGEEILKAQDILKSMELSLMEIVKEYGDYVKMEVKKDV